MKIGVSGPGEFHPRPTHPVFNVQIVQALLKEGADPNAMTSKGMTALHFAADRGYVQVVEVLGKYGAK